MSNKKNSPNVSRSTRRISVISHLHGIKLLARSLLFIFALVLYIINRVTEGGEVFCGAERIPGLLMIVWVAYAVEMLFRFFPSRLESAGCQKQFAGNYIPTGNEAPPRVPHRGILAVAAAWLSLNAVIGALYLTGLIDAGILILISLAYGVCDMICILFFCPFQTWFMKNRCCTDCRIYNWDYAMMFTPYVFVPDPYTWSLLGMSLLLLLRWEITVARHPERFSEKTNACLNCSNCKEKLCHHKKQLKIFWKKNKERLITTIRKQT